MLNKNVTTKKIDFPLITTLIIGFATLILAGVIGILSFLADSYPILDNFLVIYIPLFIIICIFYFFIFIKYLNGKIFAMRKSYIQKYILVVDLIVIFFIGLLLFYRLGKPLSDSIDEMYFEFILTIILLPFVSFLHYHVNIIFNKSDEMKLTDTKKQALVNISNKLNSINTDLIKPYNDSVNVDNIADTSNYSIEKISEMNDDELKIMSKKLDDLHDELSSIVKKFFH